MSSNSLKQYNSKEIHIAMVDPELRPNPQTPTKDSPAGMFSAIQKRKWKVWLNMADPNNVKIWLRTSPLVNDWTLYVPNTPITTATLDLSCLPTAVPSVSSPHGIARNDLVTDAFIRTVHNDGYGNATTSQVGLGNGISKDASNNIQIESGFISGAGDLGVRNDTFTIPVTNTIVNNTIQTNTFTNTNAFPIYWRYWVRQNVGLSSAGPLTPVATHYFTQFYVTSSINDISGQNTSNMFSFEDDSVAGYIGDGPQSYSNGQLNNQIFLLNPGQTVSITLIFACALRGNMSGTVVTKTRAFYDWVRK